MIKRAFIIVLLLLPFAVVAQRDSSLLDSRLDDGWRSISRQWKFKIGDDPAWAKTGFDDSGWQAIKGVNGNINQRNSRGVIWFRRTILTDSTFNKQLLLRVYQTGASEIYIDGKLIHQLGTVSTNPSAVKYYDPNVELLSFPVKYNVKQVLAIRFANSPGMLPLYTFSPKPYLWVFLTTADNAINDEAGRNARIVENRTHITIGVVILLGVLFLSFFIFFPAQKVNLYFSISSFIFMAFLLVQVCAAGYHGRPFLPNVTGMTLAAVYLLLQLYCTYKVFEQKPGKVFVAVSAFSLLFIAALFIIDLFMISLVLAILSLADSMRVSLLAMRKNKPGAPITIFSSALSLLFWVLALLSVFDVVNVPQLYLYQPFGYLIGPLGLAIYLGYAFGLTSKSLRQKLTEVEQLSNEKQEILQAQNETLETQVNERTAALNKSLEDLKSTQTQLVQREKMASLGELTAGIAHEIQNPLNFVNNFSDVNQEMIAELKAELDAGNKEEAIAIADDIAANEEKINHHGKRADAIVRGMLQHSRVSSANKEPADLNKLADEYLRLAYHGLRAKDKSFNAELITNFSADLPPVSIVPQDMGRVLLNILNNAFYAVQQKQKASTGDFKPVVEVTTVKMDGKVRVSIKDNGAGIPANIRDKIFQPFFTTKPTGQGTGLGLSLSYDIVVKAHQGQLEIDSKEGEFTKITVTLPTS